MARGRWTRPHGRRPPPRPGAGGPASRGPSGCSRSARCPVPRVPVPARSRSACSRSTRLALDAFPVGAFPFGAFPFRGDRAARIPVRRAPGTGSGRDPGCPGYRLAVVPAVRPAGTGRGRLGCPAPSRLSGVPARGVPARGGPGPGGPGRRSAGGAEPVSGRVTTRDHGSRRDRCPGGAVPSARRGGRRSRPGSPQTLRQIRRFANSNTVPTCAVPVCGFAHSAEPRGPPIGGQPRPTRPRRWVESRSPLQREVTACVRILPLWLDGPAFASPPGYGHLCDCRSGLPPTRHLPPGHVRCSVHQRRLRTAALLRPAGHRPGAGGSAAGYSIEQLATYCWVCQALFGVVMMWGWTELGDRIRTGDVVVDLLRPDHPVASYLAMDLGRAGFALLTRFTVPILVGIASSTSTCRAGSAPTALRPLPALCRAGLLRLPLPAQRVSYWLLDLRGVNVVWTFLSGVFTGLAFPLDFLPGWAAALLFFGTPLPSIMQAPVDVWSSAVRPAALAGTVAVQAGWSVGAALGLLVRAAPGRTPPGGPRWITPARPGWTRTAGCSARWCAAVVVPGLVRDRPGHATPSSRSSTCSRCSSCSRRPLPGRVRGGRGAGHFRAVRRRLRPGRPGRRQHREAPRLRRHGPARRRPGPAAGGAGPTARSGLRLRRIARVGVSW